VRNRHASLSLLVAALVAVSLILVGVAPASATTSREARMASPDLMSAARAHTTSMAGSRTLFHTASFSSLCCWEAVAENVGYGFSVRGLHRQLMRSAPHRANILNPRMRQVGVGIVERNGALWVTEVFRDPR
jgi:uncharacterized protein YkwD